jgi:hypothetical protein
MEKETLKKIFTFLEEEENKDKPFMWKLKNNEPITEDDLIVNGDLDLSDTKIRTLPNGLKIGKHLDLSRTNITSLPKGLYVGGSLLLIKCVNLTFLPKGLEVGLNLFIGKTQLTNYSDDELRKMVEPGFIKGKINR